MRALSFILPLVLLLLGGCKKERPEPVLATLTEIQGQVSVLHGAETRAGRVSEPVHQGETLVTGPGSEAVLRYVNGVEIQVEENSRFRVNGVPGALTLELEQGRIISTAPPEGNSKLTITGRFGQAEVIRAAEMVFDLRAAEPRLTLEYGEIRVVNAEGQPVQVVKGQELVFSLGKAEPPPVQVVRAKEIVFYLEPRGGAKRELGPGGAFEVPAKSTARLSSEGLQLSLAGGTAGALTSASLQGDQHAYALQLSRGEARLQFGEGQHALKLTDGRGDFELKVSEQSTLSVSHPQSGAEVRVLAGQAELVAEGKATVLKPGEALDRSAEAPQAEAASAPALLLAPEVKARVFADSLPAAGIRAPSSPEGPLRVEVASESSFREPLLAGRAGAAWVPLELPGRGERHWRFLAADGSVREQGSVEVQPDRGRSSFSGQSPRAEVLDTGLKATVYFQGAVPSLHFQFSAQEGARAYRLRVYRASDPRTVLLERAAERTQSTLEPGALGEGSYLWYVAALGAAGEELGGGRMNKLELVYDNARRGLAIRRPRQGERMGRGQVLVDGVAPLGARLLVNEQPMALDAKGRFSQRVPASQVLVFRLISAQGEAYWVRTLRSAR